MRGRLPRGSRLVHVGLGALLRLIRRDAVLDPELRERERLAPAAGVVDEVLDLSEAELAEPDQRAIVALFEHDLDGRLAPRFAPLVDEALRSLRLNGSTMTDLGIENLAHLVDLQFLYLTYIGESGTVIKKLNQALPKLEVKIGDGSA